MWLLLLWTIRMLLRWSFRGRRPRNFWNTSSKRSWKKQIRALVLGSSGKIRSTMEEFNGQVRQTISKGQTLGSRQQRGVNDMRPS
ncbi:hypothetical protein QN277_012751 [Acacia crassicarpa]|uniref:Uncharacterized protein n=1 Tax=Acacia crassicarpa TaxID=499986 RepID=A0AAE1N1F7_9FABA|nr:hypothetical protein QN277_012751 [Acacia crassicarpa]